jgi:phosphoglycerate dehydrogenase-like enzyme
MKILVTLQKGKVWDIYYSQEICKRIESVGPVMYNSGDKPLSSGELKELLNRGVEICLTHWGCPAFSAEVLEGNQSLKFIVHGAGTVASLVTDEVYRRGIAVSSSNDVMASFVAEGCMAYLLSALRLVPEADRRMKAGEEWPYLRSQVDTLYYKKIRLIGFGSVARKLCCLLRPFQVEIKAYDPCLTQDDLRKYGLEDVALVSLDEALSTGEIISLHAALTPETVKLIGERELLLIPDGAVLLNTSRGKIVDQNALIRQLLTGRFKAVLDVYEKEPLPLDSPLRDLDNVILIPHMGGSSSKQYLTLAALDEMERFVAGKPLEHSIPFDSYNKMTREL